jgi:cytidyltransferase-like protein
MKIVIVTGGFDPLHSGHISYLNHADHLGDHVVVGLNSDAWLTRKKGRPFMPWRERMIVLDNLHMVGEVIEFNDDDGSSIDAIRKVRKNIPTTKSSLPTAEIAHQENIPEQVFDDVEFVFGVGGENKANSSSWILEEWKSPKTHVPGDTIVCYTKWAITSNSKNLLWPKNMLEHATSRPTCRVLVCSRR